MTPEHQAYFERLVETINSAQKVPFREVYLDGWQPQRNDCHKNVDYWVAQNPASSAVRGWLFWPLECGQHMFLAHSVIEESGGLVDIKPIDANTPRHTFLFARHLGSEEEFNTIKTDCAQLLYPPLQWDMELI